MMRTTSALLITLALAFFLAACNQTGSSTLPGVTITSVTPASISPGVEITITGQGFYQHVDGQGTSVEVCGLTMPGSLVEAVMQTVVLPPAGRIHVEAGSQLTVTLPTEDFKAGEGELRVTRPDGSTSVLEASVTCLLPKPEPEPTPTPVIAAFTSSATTGTAPTTITFNATSSTGEGELTYQWNFGEEDEDATSTDAVTEYTFNQAGAYTVTLTITDETEATGRATQIITVAEPESESPTDPEPIDPEPDPTPAPVATIITSATTGTAPTTITFDATTSTGEGELTYHWNFGDENDDANSTDAVTDYTYTQAGAYTVTLTVTDEAEATSTATTTITVATPGADLSILVTPADLPAQIQVTGPNNYEQTITGPDALNNLEPGDYTITPLDRSQIISIEGGAYTLNWQAPAGTITIEPGSTEQTFTANYAAQTGELEVGITGLPEHLTPEFTLEQLDSDMMWQLVGSPDLGALTPGFYNLNSSSTLENNVELHDGSFTELYAPTNTPAIFTISSGETSSLTITYQVYGGSIYASSSNELPDGSDGSYSLTNADGPVPTPWINIPPGRYELEFHDVRYENEGSIERNDGSTADTLELYSPACCNHRVIYLDSLSSTGSYPRYNLVPAKLDIKITLPTGEPIEADATITYPNGTTTLHFDEATNTTVDVPLGEYHVNIQAPHGYQLTSQTPNGYFLVNESHLVNGVPNSFSIEATYERVPALGSITFHVGPSDLINTPPLTFTGGDYDNEQVTSRSTITGLPAGTYTITAPNFTHSGATQGLHVATFWTADPRITDLQLAEGEAATTNIMYVATPGELNLTATGLPDGTPANTLEFTLEDWLGQPVSNPDLGNLIPGVYTLTMQPVEVWRDNWTEIYTPSDPVHKFAVSSNDNIPLTINYEVETGSIEAGGITGLPQGIPGSYSLWNSGGAVPEPWDELQPGNYSLFFHAVDYQNPDALQRTDGTWVDAFERYNPAPTGESIDLNSNDHVIADDTHYEVGLALLDIRISSRDGGPIQGNVTITDSAGTVHRLTEQNPDDRPYHQLYVPLGEIWVDAHNPPGYQLYSPTPRLGGFFLDTSYFYGDAKTPNTFEMTYEPIPIVPINAAISVDYSGGIMAPATIGFDATYSTGEGQLAYHWDFGDGNTSAEVAPQHTYAHPGTYRMVFTVTDSLDRSRSISQNIRIEGIFGTLRFTISPTHLPSAPMIALNGLNGYQQTVASDEVLTDLPSGAYSASPVPYRWDHEQEPAFHSIWTASSRNFNFSRDERLTAHVIYSVAPGKLSSATILGLPSSAHSEATFTLTNLENHNAPGQPGSTQDWDALTPGVYTLTGDPIEVDRGAWTETYTPNPVTFAISSNETTAVTVDYILMPSNGITFAGLPADFEPNLTLENSDGQTMQGPWDSLTPGLYYATFHDTDTIIPDGITTIEGDTVPAYQTYTTDPAEVHEFYLNSGENYELTPIYEPALALLKVTIDAPIGVGGHIDVYRAGEPNVHVRTFLSRGTRDLWLPLGVYDYTIRNTGKAFPYNTTPGKYLTIDASHAYGGQDTTFAIQASYEAY